MNNDTYVRFPSRLFYVKDAAKGNLGLLYIETFTDKSFRGSSVKN